MIFGDLPSGPVVKNPLPMQGIQVQSLVGELRSHILRGNQAWVPQLEKPTHCNKPLRYTLQLEKLLAAPGEKPPRPGTRENPAMQQRPNKAKKKKKSFLTWKTQGERTNFLSFIHFQWAYWSHYGISHQEDNLLGDFLRWEL